MPKTNDGYTPVFTDLIDNINQSVKYGSAYPIDRVEQYSISQLENVLFKTYNYLSGFTPSYLEPIWQSFSISTYKSKLKSTYTNSTETDIDTLFNNYL